MYGVSRLPQKSIAGKHVYVDLFIHEILIVQQASEIYKHEKVLNK